MAQTVRVLKKVSNLVEEHYPLWCDDDELRALQLICAIPRDQYRSCDLLLCIDIAYSEQHGVPRKLDPKWFLQ